MNERAFARTADAADRDEEAEGQGDVDLAQIVGRRAEKL